ncbi:right-handed parallel beta-helix repeat-containing protein [Bacillus spongiae]|uniref:Right-handed parallel beta-helix repeat-containing protein n=1 Tax=Bacillus spongiae TaxID=2683610 RepID=A0ABU8HCT5_9BACI
MVLRIVPTDQPTVQDAINASVPGDSIKILAGKFDGFEVDVENLKIFGCGIGRTIIEGAPSQLGNNGVDVNGDRTTLQGFTVQGMPNNGVFIRSDNSVLKNIECTLNGEEGYQLNMTADENLLINCLASVNNQDGFILFGSNNCIISCESINNRGSGFDDSGNSNKFIKNTSKNNGNTGLNSAMLFQTAIRNICSNNVRGIRIPMDNNNIIENTVCNNSLEGILLLSGGGVGASGNSIDSNIVRNNGTNNNHAGILLQEDTIDNTIRFNKARNNVEFDIEAEPPADINNTFDGNQCENSSPPVGICDS